MESFNFYSSSEKFSIPIQIIKLNKSYFIYVGTDSFILENLIASFFDLNVNKCF